MHCCYQHGYVQTVRLYRSENVWKVHTSSQEAGSNVVTTGHRTKGNKKQLNLTLDLL